MAGMSSGGTEEDCTACGGASHQGPCIERRSQSVLALASTSPPTPPLPSPPADPCGACGYLPNGGTTPPGTFVRDELLRKTIARVERIDQEAEVLIDSAREHARMLVEVRATQHAIKSDIGALMQGQTKTEELLLAIHGAMLAPK